jgi:two-component system OmpR family sensor kinase
VRLLERVPTRLRLTLAFAAGMAVVLVAMGLFLYLRLGAALTQTIDQSLRGRADDVATLVRISGSRLPEAGGNRLVEQEENIAQVLDPDGTILDSTPGVGGHRLLTGPQLARATRATIMVDRPPVPGADEPLRLLATPVRAQGGLVVVAVCLLRCWDTAWPRPRCSQSSRCGGRPKRCRRLSRVAGCRCRPSTMRSRGWEPP